VTFLRTNRARTQVAPRGYLRASRLERTRLREVQSTCDPCKKIRRATKGGVPIFQEATGGKRAGSQVY